MKKVLLFALCLILVLGCVGCGADTPEWLLTKSTMVENGNTTVATYTYDGDGKLSSYEIRVNDVLNTQNEVEYDENGYKSYEKATLASGLVVEMFFTNDTRGRVTEQRTVSSHVGSIYESVSRFEYTDTYGSYVQTVVSGPGKGNTVTVTKDEKGNELTHAESAGLFIRYENTYDGEVLTERTGVYTRSGGSCTVRTVYEYDEHGNNVCTTSYDADGKVTLAQTYEYSSADGE